VFFVLSLIHSKYMLVCIQMHAIICSQAYSYAYKMHTKCTQNAHKMHTHITHLHVHTHKHTQQTLRVLTHTLSARVGKMSLPTSYTARDALLDMQAAFDRLSDSLSLSNGSPSEGTNGPSQPISKNINNITNINKITNINNINDINKNQQYHIAHRVHALCDVNIAGERQNFRAQLVVLRTGVCVCVCVFFEDGCASIHIHAYIHIHLYIYIYIYIYIYKQTYIHTHIYLQC